MQIVATDKIEQANPSGWQQHLLYNGMDTLMTLELFHKLRPYLTKGETLETYEQKLAFLPLVRAMMRRGILIDRTEKSKVILDCVEKISKLEAILADLISELDPEPFNWRSGPQLQKLFYEWLAIPHITVSVKGVVKVAVNKEAFDKLKAAYPRAVPFVKVIESLRDLSKDLEVFVKPMAPGNRFKFSFNVAGTETDRWSSSEHPLGFGSNIQNITGNLRRAFVADPGMIMFNRDLQGAEARAVGYLSGDEKYIAAVESADVHTYVASLVFGVANSKEEAEKPSGIGDFSYRDMAKRCAHGTNYMGTARTIAKILRLPVKVVEEFQELYFRTFPGIKEWHRRVAFELQSTSRMRSPSGFLRQFWGRLRDDATLREAIAFCPQNMIGTVTSQAMLRVHRTLEEPGVLELLANGHDAMLGQVRLELLHEMMPKLAECQRIPFEVLGADGKKRTLVIPSDAQVGFNWGKFDGKKKIFLDGNPNGLRDYVPGTTYTKV